MIGTIWSLLDQPDFPIFNIRFAVEISREIIAIGVAEAEAATAAGK